jgi:hypothetical protein
LFIYLDSNQRTYVKNSRTCLGSCQVADLAAMPFVVCHK